MQSEKIDALAGALATAQGEIRNAAFNRINPHFKNRYADLAAVFDALRAPFAKNKLSIAQTTELRESQLILVTTVAHASGQWIKSEYPLPASARPQELGSALTYARRYSLSAIAGIAADEDDDAEAAEKNTAKNGNGKHVNAPPSPPISEAQADELMTLLTDVGADPVKFCAYLKIERILDLPADQFDRAIAALNAKKAKQS